MIPAPSGHPVAWQRRPAMRWALAVLLSAILGSRLIAIGQPIVENYVGRQIPTAMVARNLDRGSGFGRPQLDTAPFPNLFLVEPPVYQVVVVAARRATGLTLDASGRLVSALGITLAAWGLFGLVSRRQGDVHALGAVAVFAVFPVTIRYGRAFQPDALMLGTALAGLRLWDTPPSGSRLSTKIAAGFALTSLAIALKITSAFLLVPLIAVILSKKRRLIPLAIASVIPSACWYLYAAYLLNGQDDGSRASADNGRVWLQVLVPSAWLRMGTYLNLGRFLVIRAFTPIAFFLAVFGLKRRTDPDRLWTAWGLAAAATLALLAAKLHHEYYMLILSPLIAVGVANQLARLSTGQGVRRPAAFGLILGLLTSSIWLTATTWTTPKDWSGIDLASSEIRTIVPIKSWIVAPEALIYMADRRGCRLEYTASSAKRAAMEWGGKSVEKGVDTPLDLVAFYQSKGADYFADLAFADEPPERLALHSAVRRRYNVLIDRDGLLLARLTERRL